MAGDKREVRVAVVGDAGQLQRELLKAEGKINSFGSNAKSAGDTLRTALFGGAVLYGAQQLVKAAGDLQQSIGGTAAVFKQAAGPIEDFAKNAADLVGLSENAARTITSRLGSSLQGFGLSAEEAADKSIFLTKIGADLAATLGGTTDEAVTALAAALRGEFDPLERFGIALKAADINAKAVAMGLAETETSVSNYAKGQAALALITEKSAFAQGQFAKEADTAQGQAQRATASLEDTSAKLGQSLLPIYTKIQEVVVLVAEAFGMLPAPVQTGLIGLTGIAIVGPKLVDAFGSMVSAAKTAGTAILDAGTKAVTTNTAIASMNISTQAAGTGATAAAGGLGLLGPAAIAVAGAAVIGGLAWKSYSDEQAAVAKDIKTFKESFDELTGAMTENTYETVKATLESKHQLGTPNKAGISTRQFTDVLDDNRDALASQSQVEDLLNKIRLNGVEANKKGIEALRSLGGAQNELIARLLETEAADEGLIATLYNGIDAYNEQQEAIRQLNIQKGLAEGKSEAQATAEANLASEYEKVKDKVEDLYEATSNLLGLYVSQEEADMKLAEAQKAYNDSLKNGGLSADERKQKELDLIKAFETQAKLAVENAENQAALQGKTLSAGEAAAIQSQKYKDLAGTLAPDSPLRKRIEELSLQMFLLSLQDPVVRIRVETEAAMAKFKAFLRDLGIPEGGQVGLGEILTYSSNYVEKRAAGGPVDSNTPYLVGEKGPELFMPSTAGRIIDAFSTSKALLSNTGAGMAGPAGGGITINVSVSPTADRAAIGQTIVEAISSYERRSGTGWRS